MTEGERVTIEQIQIQSTVGSFHHSVVPLPLGGRLFVSLLLSRVVEGADPYEYDGIKSLALNFAFNLHFAFNFPPACIISQNMLNYIYHSHKENI